MDITDIFKSYVKAIKIQRGLAGVDKPSLKFKTKKDDFNSKSKDIVYHITKLRDYLLVHKKEYTNINLSTSSGPSISDLEREKIDSAARNIISNCSTLLKELGAFIKKNSSSTQLYDHRKGVLDIVNNYLKSVCKIYTDLKETYARRQTEYYNVIKVIPDRENHVSVERNHFKETTRETVSEKSIKRNEPEEDDTVNKVELKSNYNLDVEQSSNNPSYSIVEELTKEELQMFEVENADLIDQLNHLKGEVKAIEQTVTHIAGLQDTFTQTVLQQDLDIQRIDTKIVGTTENVQDANLELRKAVQNNASFRFYLLFFILLLSFTLLFLNWYNDWITQGHDWGKILKENEILWSLRDKILEKMKFYTVRRTNYLDVRCS